MTFGKSGWSGPPLENAYSVAVFAMFNSQSSWVQSGKVAQLSRAAEEGMKAFWFKFLENCAKYYKGEALGNPLRLHDSENIDSVRHTGCFLGSTTLALFPEYANRSLPDKTSVREAADAWENFTHAWLKAKALHGFFDELGSSGYWTRTWPCIWALHTLTLPGSRVHRRANMFIDLAMIEAELSSLRGVRAGQRSRDKKATCPTCSRKGCNPALEHHMYTAFSPQLYGEDMDGPVGRLYKAPISTQQIGSYKMSNVSILIHKLGAAPATGGVFTVRNRMMGQIDKSGMQTCSKARCEETLRPYPCACAGGGSWHTLVPQPQQVHVISRTPAYSLAGVVFSPNDAFVANCQQRGTGLTFANEVHTAVVLPHLTGEKWGIIDQDVMIAQRCGSCNYGGSSLFHIFNASSLWQDGDCWFVTAADDATGDTIGWAAMRPAWGGTNFTNATSPLASLSSGFINLLDTWSPFVIVAADAVSYGTLENFTQQVADSTLTVDSGRTRIHFSWNKRTFEFTPGPSTWKGNWTLPSLDGQPVDIDPPFMYRSPHLNAELNSDVVEATYDTYKLIYNFSDNSVVDMSTAAGHISSNTRSYDCGRIERHAG